MKLREKIGNPVKFEEITSSVSRGHFVRMCMKFDLEKQLISKFQLRRKVRKIEY